MQTATQTSLGFKAGLKDYRLTCFMEDYKVHVNDLLALPFHPCMTGIFDLYPSVVASLRYKLVNW